MLVELDTVTASVEDTALGSSRDVVEAGLTAELEPLAAL